MRALRSRPGRPNLDSRMTPEPGLAGLLARYGLPAATGAAARAGLRNAVAVPRRAEEWPEGIGRHDLVTARALAPLGVVAEWGAPLLADGGALVAWKGRRDPEEEAMAAVAAAELGLDLV